MRRLAQTAQETGCSRVEWQTEQDSTAARKFYDDLGGNVHAGKLFYRAEGPDEIQRLRDS